MNFNVECGLKGSKITELQASTLTKDLVRNKQYINFKGVSGKEYILETTLYAYKKGFINYVEINPESNVILNPIDIYNSYRHVFMNVYFEKFNSYIENEMSEQLQLTKVEQKKIDEILRYFALSWIFTKSQLEQLVLDSTETLKYENKMFSRYLITGEETDQYLSGLIHVLKTGQFLKLLSIYSDPEYVEKLIGSQSELTMFDNFKITPLWLQYIENVLGDLTTLFNSTKSGLTLNEKYVLNEIDIKRKSGTLSDIVNIKKIIAKESGAKQVYDYFAFKTQVTEKYDFSKMIDVGASTEIKMKDENDK